MTITHKHGRSVGSEGLNPVTVNGMGYSGFGLFNSVAQARPLVLSLQTALSFGNSSSFLNSHPKNFRVPLSYKHSCFLTLLCGDLGREKETVPLGCMPCRCQQVVLGGLAFSFILVKWGGTLTSPTSWKGPPVLISFPSLMGVFGLEEGSPGPPLHTTCLCGGVECER